MDFNDEKDYIMRIIKEMVRVLFSLMLGNNIGLLSGQKKINMRFREKH